VTLLHGPESNANCYDAPLVLVSSAHCNFVCKNDFGDTLEFCCCREDSDPGTCRNSSSYCRGNATLKEASPRDLQIVCGEWSIEEVPEAFSFENELILDVIRFTNHPSYDPGEGPVGGFDISVYHVDSGPLCARNKEKGLNEGDDIYPACLPKSKYESNEAILATWIDPQPSWKFENNRPYFQYRVDNLWTRQARMKETECKDPAWMGNSNTFYPAGTRCYSDPTGMSCHTFGTSGSSAVRLFKDKDNTERYSWIGPLSFYRGCDRAWVFRIKPFDQYKTLILDAGENPGVFTDGSCYLGWIADQYKMRLPKEYRGSTSCRQTSGSLLDKDVDICLTNTGNVCDFSAIDPITGKAFDKCKTLSVEGYSKSVNTCIAKGTTELYEVCSNNCRGVDPKSIIVGGIPVVAASGLTALSVAQSIFGITALTVGGAGSVAFGSYFACVGPLYCQVGGGRCCLLVTDLTRGLICPPSC